MNLHQKRVTITAVDLSKVSENCCVVINTNAYLESGEVARLTDMLKGKIPDGTPIVFMREGESLNIKDIEMLLPKEPAPEMQKEQEIVVDQLPREFPFDTTSDVPDQLQSSSSDDPTVAQPGEHGHLFE